MPALVLKNHHSRSKPKENAAHLEQWLRLWNLGRLKDLTDEGHTIQQQFLQTHARDSTSSENTSRVFAKLMMEGKLKVRATLRLISKECSGRLSTLIDPAPTKLCGTF